MALFYPSLPALYILIAYFSAKNMQLDFKGRAIDSQKNPFGHPDFGLFNTP